MKLRRMAFPVALLGLVMALLLPAALAQGVQGIYVCTNAQGKRITSDRPIAECADREQRELNQSGSLKRTLAPPLTAAERAQLEEAAKLRAEERAKELEERKRNRSLLVRYPNKAAHDRELEQALEQVERVGAEAQKRLAELTKQSTALTMEADFYKSSKTAMAPLLVKKIEQNTADLKIQRDFLVAQEEEKKRIHARFDDDRRRLAPLWADVPSSATAALPKK